MKIKELKDINYDILEKENLLLSVIDKTDKYDVAIAKIRPHEEMTLHLHNRPNNGEEIFLFFKGGKFKINGNMEERKFSTNEAVLVRFEPKEAHSIRNLSKKELKFLAFYVPPFKPGEVITLK